MAADGTYEWVLMDAKRATCRRFRRDDFFREDCEEDLEDAELDVEDAELELLEAEERWRWRRLLCLRLLPV